MVGTAEWFVSARLKSGRSVRLASGPASQAARVRAEVAPPPPLSLLPRSSTGPPRVQSKRRLLRMPLLPPRQLLRPLPWEMQTS